MRRCLSEKAVRAANTEQKIHRPPLKEHKKGAGGFDCRRSKFSKVFDCEGTKTKYAYN